MTKKLQYIVLGVVAVLFILWSARLMGLLLLGVLCVAAPVLQKRFAVYSIDDFEARIATVPRLARAAVAVVAGAYIGNVIGRAFLLGTSLCTVLFAAGLGCLAWYVAGRQAPPS